MARRKGTSVALLHNRNNNKHAWLLRNISGKEDYIIEGLSALEAVRLYKETKDERYVEHVFFSNLGYFLNTIVATMSLYGEDFHYTEVNDYLGYAYEAVRYGMERFNVEKSTKIMSYLAGSVFMRLRKAIRDEECRWWNEYSFHEQDENDEDNYNASVEYYKKASEERYNEAKDLLDVNIILNELFERYKEQLAKLGINSVDEMHRLYGEWSTFTESQKNILRLLRKEMRRYLRERYKDFLD